jgi:hypothetical protein
MHLVVLQCKIYFRLPVLVHNAMVAEFRGSRGGNCKRQPSNLRGDKEGGRVGTRDYSGFNVASSRGN